MGKTEDDIPKYGRLLFRAILGLVGILLVWTVVTVHQLTIDVAVMQNTLERIETYWSKE